MLEGTGESRRPDERYLRGLSRGLGLGVGFKVRFRFRARIGLRTRFGLGLGFGAGLGQSLRYFLQGICMTLVDWL